jgi:hypothetical protein
VAVSKIDTASSAACFAKDSPVSEDWNQTIMNPAAAQALVSKNDQLGVKHFGTGDSIKMLDIRHQHWHPGVYNIRSHLRACRVTTWAVEGYFQKLNSVNVSLVAPFEKGVGHMRPHSTDLVVSRTSR